MNVDSSIVHDSQKLETSQRSIPVEWIQDIFVQWNSENGIQTMKDSFHEREDIAAPDATG